MSAPSSVIFKDYSPSHESLVFSKGKKATHLIYLRSCMIPVVLAGPYGADKMTIPDFSSLTLHDGEDDARNSRNSISQSFDTPNKLSQESIHDEDLDSAIESKDFAVLEGLGLKLALMARMGDLSGIKRIIGQSCIDSNLKSVGSVKSQDNDFHGPETSSSLLSTPDTVVAAPTSPISPRLGMSNYFSRGLYGDRMSFSPYITSVKSTGQGISSERV